MGVLGGLRALCQAEALTYLIRPLLIVNQPLCAMRVNVDAKCACHGRERCPLSPHTTGPCPGNKPHLGSTLEPEPSRASPEVLEPLSHDLFLGLPTKDIVLLAPPKDQQLLTTFGEVPDSNDSG